eukprot:452567_1
MGRAVMTRTMPAVSNAERLNVRLENFWEETLRDMRRIRAGDGESWKTRELPFPLSRVKRLMRVEETISNNGIRLDYQHEVPLVLIKAAEVFVSELCVRANMHAEDNKRSNIVKHDMVVGITNADMYDFLLDIVLQEDKSRINDGERNNDDGSGDLELSAFEQKQCLIVQQRLLKEQTSSLKQQGVSEEQLQSALQPQLQKSQQQQQQQTGLNNELGINA